MNPNDIVDKLNKNLSSLSRGNVELKTLGIKKAESERLYRTALAKKILLLRLDKYPVSLINDLARGDEEVSKLRFNRDVSESNYYCCKSSMDSLKTEIEVLRSKLAWLKVEFKNY